MLGEKGAKKNLGVAGATGTALFCLDIDPLLDFLGLAASPLFSGERGAQTLQDIAYQVRKLVFPLLFKNLLCLTLLDPQAWTLGKVFQITVTAWDRRGDWFLTYQEVIPCLVLKDIKGLHA